MLDSAVWLLSEDARTRGDGEVELLLGRDEINFEAVETCRLARAWYGGGLVEVAVAGDLCTRRDEVRDRPTQYVKVATNLKVY